MQRFFEIFGLLLCACAEIRLWEPAKNSYGCCKQNNSQWWHEGGRWHSNQPEWREPLEKMVKVLDFSSRAKPALRVKFADLP